MKSYENSAEKPVIETTENAFKIVLPNKNEKGNKVITQGTGNDLEVKVLDFIRQHGAVMRKDVEEIRNILFQTEQFSNKH